MADHFDGGPAFPIRGSVADYQYAGPSLRDHIATQALVGLMGRAWDSAKLTDQQLIEQWADSAYIVADAMLRARRFLPSDQPAATPARSANQGEAQ